MDKLGHIEVRVTGKEGNTDLHPDNHDIRYIAQMLQDVEALLYPDGRRERPNITYNLQEGSVRHLFKTSMQAIIGFSAILTQVNEQGSIDFLESRTAAAFERIQETARQKDYQFQFKTSLKEDYELSIGRDTQFIRAENTWAEAEFYFYGTLKNAGGKKKANIHLDTTEYGYLVIETGQEFLRDQEENMLYKEYGVRAVGRQNVATGELDKQSLRLIEFIDYSPAFDEHYLGQLIKNAKGNWQDVDADDWLHDLRGTYEA
ncbi:MAG: hypothetical protein AAGA62_10115 [Bacteroidota bacterium]